MNCILCRNEIADRSGIQGILWKGEVEEVKEDYIEIAICDSCKERIKAAIQGKMDSSPIVRMAFKRYLKLVPNDILSFLTE